MNSNIKERARKLKTTEKNYKLNVMFLESLIFEFERHNKHATKDPTIRKARSVIKNSLEKVNKISSSVILKQKSGLSISSKLYFKSSAGIEKLSNNVIGNGTIACNQLNGQLIYLSVYLNKEMQKLTSHIKNLEKKLSKFQSSDERKQTDSDIFIELLKKSNKTPTVESLALFSNNRISKSTWDRKLKNDRFLYYLTGKIQDLIERTKNMDKINFYATVHSTVSKKFEIALTKKSKNEKIYQERLKKKNRTSYSNSGEDIFDDEENNSWLQEEN